MASSPHYHTPGSAAMDQWAYQRNLAPRAAASRGGELPKIQIKQRKLYLRV